MAGFKIVPPVWYWIVSVALALWGMVGVYACYMQIKLGAESMGPATDYDRAWVAALPGWYYYVFAVAVGTGLLGALALLARSKLAKPLYVVSFLGLAWQFGYDFLATDLIAHKGPMVALSFPIFLFVIALASIWFAGLAQRRGWTS